MENQIQTLTFNMLPMTIGVLPSSYVDSMSYYETLLWLCNYLENTVIPTVNNNGQAVEELQEKYIELKSYVDHYFDNLDVQNEINNKLDALVQDGTIYNLINTDVFNDLNSQILENANNISIINNNIPDFVKAGDTNAVTMTMLSQEVREALTGGSTAVVANDTITVNNLQDSSIYVDKLDSELKENFNENFEVEELTYSGTGYYYIDDGVLAQNSDNQYNYAEVSLTKDTHYEFKGFNFYAVLGCIIVDDQDNILESTLDTSTNTGLRPVKLSYTPTSSGCKALISIGTGVGSYNNWVKNNQKFMKTSNVSLNYRSQDVNLIHTIDNFVCNYGNTIGTRITGLASSGANVKIYKMNKGTHYHINSFNYYDIAGVVLTDENMLVTYKSSSASTTPKTYIEYDFTATVDGYIYLSSDTSTDSSIIILNNATSKYKYKKWAILGDSISDPLTLGDDKMYADYIHDDIGINVQNLAKSGAGYWKRNINNEAFYQQALNIDSDVDVITLMGSWNDLGTQGGTTGTQIIGLPTDTGTDTICGCINTTFDNIFATCPNAVVGVILPTPWYNHHGYTNTWDSKYLDPLKDICIARSIPILDLYEGSNLMPWNETFNSMFYLNSDGTHPNTRGQKRIAGLIENFVTSLIM